MSDGIFRLTHEPLSPFPSFLQADEVGAVVSFYGQVRNHNAGQRVVALEYTAYPALACTEGERILKSAIHQFHLTAAVCVHRLGALKIGDLAVAIWTASAHRNEAFSACRWIIDEVKTHVPIWKKETYFNGAKSWVTCPHFEKASP